MTLFEYNNLEINDRYKYLFTNREDNYIEFNCFRDDDEYKYSLWDCGYFFVEMQASKVTRKVVKIEGIALDDKRIDLYIDFLQKHCDEYE